MSSTRISYPSLVAVLGADSASPAVRALVRHLGEELTLERIEQLGFWDSHDKGLSLVLKDNLYLVSGRKEYRKEGPMTVVAVHLYSAGYQNHREYQGDLLDTLSFGEPRERVIQKLGPPSKSGGGNEAGGLVWPYWDRFDYPDHLLRVQYDTEAGKIEILTLMALSESCGRHRNELEPG